MRPSFVIALTQMWESFSFFGMRALLVLYLVSGVGYDPASSVILYTLYIALVKVFGGAGGIIVDRFLGYKQAVLTGGLFILTGHLLLTFTDLFFLSLGCIVVGSALFRVSLQTLLGLVGDPKGFTIFYVGMNLGGLAAAILCGIVAEVYGWHAGFGLAAAGMVLGLLLFFSKRHSFDTYARPKQASTLATLPLGAMAALGIGYLLSHFSVVHPLALPLGCLAFLYLLKQGGKGLLLSLLLLVGFSTVEELWGSLLMLFSDTHVDRSLFGLTIPSAVIAATNPLVIIFAGPLLSRLTLRYGTKLMMGFLSLALAFFCLYGTALLAHPSVLFLIAGLSLIAVGEVLIVPAIFDFVARQAPGSGTMAGATILALSMGALLSGEVAQIHAAPAPIFLGIGCAALLVALVVGKISNRRILKSSI